MHPSVHWSSIYDGQDMDATLMSTLRGTDEVDADMYTVEYDSAI